MRPIKYLVTLGLTFCLTTSWAYADNFTNIRGWNSAYSTYSGAQGEEGTAVDIDVDGEVGHPVYVSYPTALCEPSNNWSLGLEVKSGALPPGLELSMDSGSYGAIKGIPTKRGHWIVTMRTYDLKCEDAYYMGFTQQIRFHITGTGEVIQ